MPTANEPQKTERNKMDRNLPISTDSFDPVEVNLFPERTAMMIDGSKKRKPLVDD